MLHTNSRFFLCRTKKTIPLFWTPRLGFSSQIWNKPWEFQLHQIMFTFLKVGDCKKIRWYGQKKLFESYQLKWKYEIKEKMLTVFSNFLVKGFQIWLLIVLGCEDRIQSLVNKDQAESLKLLSSGYRKRLKIINARPLPPPPRKKELPLDHHVPVKKGKNINVTVYSRYIYHLQSFFIYSTVMIDTRERKVQDQMPDGKNSFLFISTAL